MLIRGNTRKENIDTADRRYLYFLNKLRAKIPDEEYNEIMMQDRCELERDFLGFVDIYGSLRDLIPENMVVIDFGCYLAAQSYFFTEHKKYIGVDVVRMKRFAPFNAKHYVMSIQDFIKNEAQSLCDTYGKENIFAICSYVPDFNATDMVKEYFPNVCCYYPGVPLYMSGTAKKYEFVFKKSIAY